MPDYADLVYTGRWFAPLRESMDAFFREATRNVTGTVAVKLYKGSATALSAKSPYSLYREDLATFGASAAFDHKDSYGFVRLYGLPGMVAAKVRREAAAAAAPVAGAKPAAGKPGAKKSRKVLV